MILNIGNSESFLKNAQIQLNLPNNDKFSGENQLVDCPVWVVLHVLVVGQTGYEHVTFGTPAVKIVNNDSCNS